MRGPCLIVLLFFITLVSCKKKTASWETDWSIPLINDRLSLSDLENDSTLEANGVGGYNVVLSRRLIDLQLDEIVAIPDTTIEKAITIAFPSLSVPPGFTISNTAEENDISIADLELKEIQIKSGNIRFRVLNPVETSMNFTVNLPGTVKDGGSFSESYLVPAGSPTNPGIQIQAYDISGYSFDLTGLNNNKNNLFVSQIDVTSDPNGPTVTMTNTDSIKFYVEFENVVLDHARGYFGQTSLSDTLQQTISTFNTYESGVFDIPNISLGLDIVNGVKVGARATISSLISTSANGSNVNLTHPQIGNAINIDPATGSWGSLVPSVNTLSINSSNSNIESFIEINKLRYAKEDDIQISFDVSGDLSDYMIPPMLLIPFVENAFKHGVDMNHTSYIEVQLTVEDQLLLFNIKNSNFKKEQLKRTDESGIGLENVKRRLELLYPDRYRLDIQDDRDMFHVLLELQHKR